MPIRKKDKAVEGSKSKKSRQSAERKGEDRMTCMGTKEGRMLGTSAGNPVQ